MKVAVGISGGVDSAVAALLLREAGHDVTGVTMTLGRADDETSLAESRRVADRLGIPLAVFDLSRAWKERVLGYIRETSLAGRTPNPCVRCNESVKFGLLPRLAFDACGAERFATGHYARTERAPDGGVRLLRALDRTKDQSYFLYRVPGEILGRTIFPLGILTKGEVRAKARAFGLDVAERKDSQDFCGGDPADVVGAADRTGNVVDASGRILGTHAGFWHHTVGQRRGLGIGGGTPYYVVGLRADRNEVVVGTKEESVRTSFGICDAVWLDADRSGGLTVKVRSAGEPKGPVELEGATVRCPQGLAGVAPGQSAVFFRGDRILGGGIIAG